MVRQLPTLTSAFSTTHYLSCHLLILLEQGYMLSHHLHSRLNAILAVLFGSYSIPITFAGIPSFLFLLKSIILYFLLSTAAAMSYCNFTLIVTTGMFFFNETTNDFSGVAFCYFCEIRTSHVSSGRCIWVICLNSHYFSLLSLFMSYQKTS